MLQKKTCCWLLVAGVFFQTVTAFAKAIDEPDPTNPQPDSATQTKSKTFDVTAEITNGCRFDQTSYELKLVLDADTKTASAADKKVTLLCTLNTNLRLSLDNGTNPDGSGKRLKNADGDYISYNLIMSEESGGAGQDQLTHTFSAQGVKYEFYIRATATIDRARAGDYQDTVTFVTNF